VLPADPALPPDFAADATFDLVLAPQVLHSVADWPSMNAEFRRVLRPGGHLVF
jgi:ubiquinone/menaquinone biosynthesis C-methylase UbiE